jgi:Family of unknown function (DUF6152)
VTDYRHIDRVRALRLLPVTVALCTLGFTARAHHSFAMFDTSSHLKVSGTVRKLEWQNPHIWLWIDVDDGKGAVVVYGFEGAAPGEAARMGGWNKHSVNPGDRVIVQYSPLKDGRPGGTLGQVTTAAGKIIGAPVRAGAPEGAPPGAAPPPPGPPPPR